MSAAKGLSITAGIFTLIGTFLLSWYSTGTEIAYGIGGVFGLLRLFSDLTNWINYIVIACVILLLISFILQFIGVKSRATAIIGAILPLVASVFIILDTFGLDILGVINYMSVFETSFTLVPGIIPFDFVIPTRTESIGTYVLFLGGLLSFISGCMSRSIYY
ncbi:MAG: hypothetical protein ACTSYC_11985 [Promethearchaeota archaeon]